MQCTMRAGLRLPARLPVAARKSAVVKAIQEKDAPAVVKSEVKPAAEQPKPVAADTTSVGNSELAKPFVDFFNSEDVRLSDVVGPITNSELYNQYLKDYVESPVAQDSFGWKKLPETINGRAAMLGFVAAAGAEIFGQGPVLQQLGSAPLPVLLTVFTIAVASVIPVYLGNKGDYIKSLQDVYTIPEGWFTETNERVNGRVAMLGLFLLIVVETFIGHALL